MLWLCCMAKILHTLGVWEYWSSASGVEQGLQLLHSSRTQLSSNSLDTETDVFLLLLRAPQHLLGQLKHQMRIGRVLCAAGLIVK